MRRLDQGNACAGAMQGRDVSGEGSRGREKDVRERGRGGGGKKVRRNMYRFPFISQDVETNLALDIDIWMKHLCCAQRFRRRVGVVRGNLELE